jgi:hypothetical protein
MRQRTTARSRNRRTVRKPGNSAKDEGMVQMTMLSGTVVGMYVPILPMSESLKVISRMGNNR